MCGVSTANIQIFLTQIWEPSRSLLLSVSANSAGGYVLVATLGKADEGTSWLPSERFGSLAVSVAPLHLLKDYHFSLSLLSLSMLIYR